MKKFWWWVLSAESVWEGTGGFWAVLGLLGDTTWGVFFWSFASTGRFCCQVETFKWLWLKNWVTPKWHQKVNGTKD